MNRDPESIAAEATAIAWRRRADVPTSDARPWLIVTARVSDGIPSAAPSCSAPARRSPVHAGVSDLRLSNPIELEADTKDDRPLRRLRATRPVAAEPGDHAPLLARIVAEPGDPRLIDAPQDRSPRLLSWKLPPWTRPRLLAGATGVTAATAAAARCWWAGRRWNELLGSALWR